MVVVLYDLLPQWGGGAHVVYAVLNNICDVNII